MMKTLRRLAIFVLMVMPPAFSSGRVMAAGEPVINSTEQILLLVGRSAVVRTDRAIQRVSLSTPEIADAMVTAPRELLVHGKAPGTISLFVWSDNGRITNYEVIVRRDLTALEGQIRRQFPNEPIAVAVNGKDVVLSGIVSAKHVIDRAGQLAAGYVDKPENIVNMMRQTESPMTSQVMLRVRFAEVGRSAMQELGVSMFTGPNGAGDWLGRSTTQQYPAPTFDQDRGLVFSDFLNLFLFDAKNNIGGAIKALQNKGLFQSLAEPNLIAENGKEASFLAGGEFPIPIAQGGSGSVAISVMFKEFGVRLNFTPTVTSDNRVRLKVRPEVSTLDFANAIVLQGFRIPALSTRRTETELELDNGQTFAVAGLLNNTMTESLQKVPGIGDIPILGYLFRSKAAQKNRTELVVMITPEILPQSSPGVTSETPRMQEPYLGPLPQNKQLEMPGPAFTPQGDNPALVARPRPSASTQQPQTPEPARTAAQEAADVLRARMPKAPTMMTQEAPAANAPAAQAPAAAATPEPATSVMPAAQSSSPEEPTAEARPLTKDEMKRLEKARDEEKKAEERRRKEEEKAAKQAKKDAEKAMKEAEKAAKREKQQS
jgi:pilus assembly protein CpaC